MPTLDFKGKQFIYTHHLSVPFRTLEMDRKRSLPVNGRKPSLDDNLIIHGDNLHALKALLPTHAGKIDCIYIDPPYNTGNEKWCYNDAVNNLLMREWLAQNSPVDKEDLERHDKWLCMMWPRLRVLRELLSEMGSIWVNLDDNEVHRARQLMDEIFGEEHFVTQLVWQKRTSRENRATFSNVHDHLIVYSKSHPQTWKTFRNLLDPGESGYSNPDNDPRGEWASIPFSAQGYRENQVYDITTPTGQKVTPPRGRCWGATEPVFQTLLSNNRVYFPREGDGLPRIKQFREEGKGLVPSTIWLASEVGDNEESKKEILEIFEKGTPFDTPKPVRLIEAVIRIASAPSSTILDSFAGSGTTAHAVLDLNKHDGGNRRFILVECEDYADRLTAERVRRVIKGYKFSGTKREELWSRRLTFKSLRNFGDLLKKSDSFDMLDGKRFDKIVKKVEAGVLKVIGEKTIAQRVEGIRGSFAYCELGPEIGVEGMLTGKKLPDYAALARYVYYTATGRALEKDVSTPRKNWLIGETEMSRLHLIYKADKGWLRSNDAALNATAAEAIHKASGGKKRCVVFAAVKFVGQKELSKEYGIEFCQLPFAIHRILGD